ncbi:MAG TPA: ribonuclease H-like domain-containing protein [Vicinamibacterales bacterium]|nr:ribonuclease H-like domain-containing protein [Vicinamibacterales bacterium]
MDLTSRLRGIVGGTPPRREQDGAARPLRELTYEPDDGYRQAAPLDLDRVADALSGRRVSNRYGECLVIDRRYEAERWHGGVRIGECELGDLDSLRVLDPTLPAGAGCAPSKERAIFIDLETTGLSGGAGTLAFLVGCGYFDLGAFHVRQFLLPGHSSERALLAAVAEFLDDAGLIVTYNGKTFDVPVMETRWSFHRLDMPAIGGDDGVPHFDMLHTARRLWKKSEADDDGCRLSTLERKLFDVHRVGDVPGFEIPGRFFGFVRSGDARPLEPVLEHNRIDLVSLAAVTARAMNLARQGHEGCADNAEALALGRIYERAERFALAEACYRRAARSSNPFTRADALYRLGIRLRRERRFNDAAAVWRELMQHTDPSTMRRGVLGDLRQVAVEALAIHHEHRAKDLAGARELALASLDECDDGRAESVRHRLARLDRKLGRRSDAQLFG